MNTLADKAVLVGFSTSMPKQSKKDRTITDEVKSQHNLEEAAGRWTKSLWHPDSLKGVREVVNAARTSWYYRRTLAWTDAGARLMPAASLWEFRQEFDSWKFKHSNAVATFVNEYDDHVAAAARLLNGTFDPTQYPPQHDAAAMFKFSLDILPVPSGNDFRVQLATEDMEAAVASVERRVTEAKAAAQAEVWQRLAEPVKAMVDRLGNPKAIFRDSLIGNVREIVDLLPALVIDADPQLEAFRAEVKATLAHHDPQTLRDNAGRRAEVARQAADIARRMSGLFPTAKAA